MNETDDDDDDLTDPGGEAYSSSCPWFGQEIRTVDRWNDGSLHCSRCGRSTEIVDGVRVHAR